MPTNQLQPRSVVQFKPDLPTLQKAIEDMNKGDDPPEEGTIIKLPGAA